MDSLAKVLITIKQEYGDEIIEDIARLNALMMDYAPDKAKERKLIINALKEGVLTQMRRGIEEENEGVDFAVRRCVALLVSEMWITESAAQYVVNVMLQLMGRTHSLTEEAVDENIIEAEDKQLIKGNASFGSIVHKEDLSDYTSIGYKAFASNHQLKEVELPDSIKRIYPKAFFDCSSLNMIYLNKNIEAIGRGVFDGCTALDDIRIDNNSTFTVSKGLLIDKKEKRLIRNTNNRQSIVPVVNGVKIISRRAFEGTAIEQITIPGTVGVIEEDAFFLTMKLQEISVDHANHIFRSIDGVLHSRDGRVLLKYPQGKKDISYYIEDSVTKIGKKAFSCAIKLASITFVSGLKMIESNAFEYCLELENIMLPRSVEVIGERAFQYCKKVKSVMLPQGIIKIGDCAFLGCEQLQTVSVPRSVEEIGNMAFDGCQQLSKVVIQENVRFLGDRAFHGCPNLEIVAKNNEYVVTYCRTHGIKCVKA